MKTVLVTGFTPFGGEKLNPSYEAVRLLPDTIEGARIEKLELPTVYSTSAPMLAEAIERLQPDIVLCCGQAGGRNALTPEQVAINLIDAGPDNDGVALHDTPVVAGAPDGYFTTLPVKKMIAAMREGGVPASLSLTAGTYVCNFIMYHLLHLAGTKYPQIKGGFMHVPFTSAQIAARSNAASLPLELIAKGIELAIAAALKEE